jgi:(R,R)-butanediol dehydrogenase/meso-butanediol dehydrogenase/diacetyl reductase
MRAAIFRAVGQPLQLVDAADPRPEDTQVVIGVGRCGICSTDIHVTEHDTGMIGSDCVLGHEYAGEIVEIGARVSRFKVGDRVCALPLQGCGRCEPCLLGLFMWCPQVRPMWGGFAQYTLANESSCVAMNGDVSMAAGALAEPLAAGLHAVHLSGSVRELRVAVVGAGPIGLSVTHWASRLGARVAVVARSHRNAALAQAFGGSSFLVNSPDIGGELSEALSGAPDLVFECSGIGGLINSAVEWVRPRGTVVVAGLCMSLDWFKPLTAVLKEVRIQFSVAYSLGEFAAAAAATGKSSVLQSMVSDTVGLSALPEYFEQLRKRHDQCKVMIDPRL